MTARAPVTPSVRRTRGPARISWRVGARMGKGGAMSETPERWSAGTVHRDMWVDPNDDPRETTENPVGERATLVEYLEHYRMTLEMKCEGLDAQQLARRSVPPSTLSLLGLVRHLAKVEHSWFRRVMGHQLDLGRIYWSAEDRDLDFNGAVPDDAVVADAWESWRREVAHAREVVDAADTLDLPGELSEGPIALREVLVHMIEEYARHCGHADLLRECIDGRTGQ
jgi:hypothetical protein